jgi:hypothetical protein
MTTIYDRLQIDIPAYGNNITQFNQATSNTMNSIPSIMPEWQQEDIGNNTTTGYTTNPLSNVLTSIYNSANSLYFNANLVSGLVAIKTAASGLISETGTFRDHTNRLSGLNEPTASTVTKPHYSTAVGIGKALLYMVNKSDDVQNNSPIMGCFSSIFTQSNLTSYSVTMSTDANTVNNSITFTPGMPFGTYTSNLSNAQITAITNDIISVSNFMSSSRIRDENYFTNASDIIQQYQNLKIYSSIGQTEKYLLNNFIGTDKLKSRIN